MVRYGPWRRLASLEPSILSTGMTAVKTTLRSR